MIVHWPGARKSPRPWRVTPSRQIAAGIAARGRARLASAYRRASEGVSLTGPCAADRSVAWGIPLRSQLAEALVMAGRQATDWGGCWHTGTEQADGNSTMRAEPCPIATSLFPGDRAHDARAQILPRERTPGKAASPLRASHRQGAGRMPPSSFWGARATALGELASDRRQASILPVERPLGLPPREV
jgi:hypothetical protein